MKVKKISKEWEIWDKEEKVVKSKGQKIGILKISQVDSYLWKESKWEDADKEVVKLSNKGKESVCTEKRKGV